MRNVQMIRTEPDLVCIPLEKAVYCRNCEMVSTSSRRRCGLCGSERIEDLAMLLPGPTDSGPGPASPVAIAVPLAA